MGIDFARLGEGSPKMELIQGLVVKVEYKNTTTPQHHNITIPVYQDTSFIIIFLTWTSSPIPPVILTKALEGPNPDIES